MASTYSSRLRLELMGSGDQSGVWGNTTNTNLGTLVEASIAGRAAVSMTDADYTLTVNFGAVDEARNMILNISGALTATRNVNCPPVSKLYVVKNATTGSQSIVLRPETSAGVFGTGITVANGETAILFCDGVNVVDSYSAKASTSQIPTLIQALYPVGSVYINATNSTNPASLFGFGTWVAFGAGRVPVGLDSSNALFDSPEETGGAANSIVVSHAHTGLTGNATVGHVHAFSAVTDAQGAHNHLTGGNAEISPYGEGTGRYGIADGWSGARQNYSNTTGYDTYTSSVGNHQHNVSGTTGGVSNSHQHYITTDAAGSSGANANYQPYITVYMWKRTA